MKTNELRTNSIVFTRSIATNNDRFKPKVHQLNLTEEFVMDTYDKEVLNYNPIFISKEWLEKLGLEKLDKDSNVWWTEDGLLSVSIERIEPEKIGGWEDVISIYLSGHDMDLAYEGFIYVHQLQNMYFGLTGKELKLIK